MTNNTTSEPLNPYQITAAQEYAGGDFAWIIDHEDWRHALSDIGDTHFVFLMRELSTAEDCEDKDDALSRLQKAADEIETIYDAIDALDDASPQQPSKDSRIIATFIPQQWINKHAVNVDPLGETHIDITDTILAMDPHAALALRDDTNETDVFKDLPNAPSWIANWSGPFYVAVEAAIAQYFDLSPSHDQTT